MQNRSVTILPYAGSIFLDGAITEASAIEIHQGISLLCGYYQHERIRLDINSLGGQTTSLDYLLDCIARHRAAGVCIRTEACFQAASAAATLFALGDVGQRCARRQTRLLFHDARVLESTQPLTAGQAIKLGSALNKVSRGFEKAIAAHLVSELGDVAGLAREGAKRCLLVEERLPRLMAQLDSHSAKRAVKWARRAEQVWKRCADSNSPEPYLSFMRRRFAEDTAMELVEAYVLMLLDRVDQVDALEPIAARSVVAPNTDLGMPLPLAA